MKFVLAVLVFVLQALPAGAQGCVTPSEKQAFDIIALKSELMVGALSCGYGEQYDIFMTAFQPFILAQQHVMDGYFRRTGGLAGQTDEDSFVTLLANTQSEAGITQGPDFCAGAPDAFATILALKSVADLTVFAAGDGLPAPIALDLCPAAPAAPAAPKPAPVETVAQAAARDLVRAEPLAPPLASPLALPRQIAAAGPAHAKIKVALRGRPAVKKPAPAASPVMVTQTI